MPNYVSACQGAGNGVDEGSSGMSDLLMKPHVSKTGRSGFWWRVTYVRGNTELLVQNREDFNTWDNAYHWARYIAGRYGR